MKIIIKLLFLISIVNSIPAQELAWKHTGGPFGGIVGDIAIDSDGDLYVGLYDGWYGAYSGFYKSTDEGKNWNRIETGFGLLEIYAVYIDNEDNLWVGTLGHDQLYFSGNGGETWEIRNEGYNVAGCWAIGENPNGVIFAGDGRFGEIFRSTDKGKTWEQSSFFHSLCFTSDGDTIMYSGAKEGLMGTRDNGLTWGQNTPLAGIEVASVAIDSSGKIYCGTGFNYTGNGIYVSDDKGVTWENIGPDSTTVLSLALDGKGTIYAGTDANGFYKTTDEGENWTRHTAGLYGKPVSKMVLDKKGNIYVSSEDEGVFRSTDGGNSFRMIGLPVEGVFQMDTWKNEYIYTATKSGLQRYDRKKEVWENLGFHFVESVSVSPEGVVFAATNSEGLYKSSDLGETWSLTNLTKDTLMTVYNVLAINRDTLFAVTNNKLRITYDGGETWKVLNIVTGFFNSGILLTEDNSVIVTGSSSGREVFFRTYDYGTSFDTLLAHEKYNNLFKNCFGSSNNNLAIVDHLSESFLYTSYDNGKTWKDTLIHNNLNCVYVEEGGLLLIGGKDSLYYSDDFGNTIAAHSTPYKWMRDIFDIMADETNSYLIGTTAGGLYKLDIVTGVEEHNGERISGYHLFQNYPNPFNPVTNIKYSLPEAGYVKVKVYDTLGREVAVPVNSYQNAGLHETSFDASGFSSGVYIYKITAGNYTAARKMLLLR